MKSKERNRSRRAWMAPAIVLAALAVAWLVFFLWPKAGTQAPDAWKAHANGALLVMAHQGGAMERPSESNLAFEYSAAIEVDAFELDVALTADGVLAVIHDTTLDRTTDGSGPVRAKTYAEIKLLDAGYGLQDLDESQIRDKARNPYIGVGAYIPSLDELFRTYPAMPMLVEIKDAGETGALAAAELRRLVDLYDRAALTLVASFHGESMAAFSGLPGKPTVLSASMPEAYKFYILHALGINALNNGLGFGTLSLPVSAKLGPLAIDLTAQRLRRDVASRGMVLYYWTINDNPTMAKLVDLAAKEAVSGIGGIITDRPGVLIQVLKDRGLR
jgi:glycerophosphoryl diester phosphodiesterase